MLLRVDRRLRLRRPALFALYVVWYTTFRTYEDTLRIDILSLAFVIRWQFQRAEPVGDSLPVMAGRSHSETSFADSDEPSGRERGSSIGRAPS